jgi:membrane protease YdiL (CAAX protease family)
MLRPLIWYSVDVMNRTQSIEPRLLIIIAAGLGMVGYMYLTPPADMSDLLAKLLGPQRMTADTARYIQRFAVSFLLLGLLPMGAAVGCGYRPRDLGWRGIEGHATAPWLAVAVSAGALSGVLSGVLSPYFPGLAAFYPYDPLLVARTIDRGIAPFLVHASSYLLFYYVPWEMLFRGVLIFTLVREMRAEGRPEGHLVLIASLQAIPSALLHYGHPVSETLSALLFGVVAAIVTVKTRSLLPALFFHASVGIGLDAAIVFGARG